MQIKAHMMTELSEQGSVSSQTGMETMLAGGDGGDAGLGKQLKDRNVSATVGKFMLPRRISSVSHV